MLDIIRAYKENYQLLSSTQKLIHNILCTTSVIIAGGTIADRYVLHPHYYSIQSSGSNLGGKEIPLGHFETQDYVLGGIHLVLGGLANTQSGSVSSKVPIQELCDAEICKAALDICTESRKSLYTCSEIVFSAYK